MISFCFFLLRSLIFILFELPIKPFEIVIVFVVKVVLSPLYVVNEEYYRNKTGKLENFVKTELSIMYLFILICLGVLWREGKRRRSRRKKGL